jgi:ferredoxin--NADP+ reductase
LTRPHRVAIVGAGPAGFYAAQGLVTADPPCDVDLFDRLPMPYGLVRYGVAPDHQNIKTVIRAFERTGKNPRVRFFGNVALGRDLFVEDLDAHYDQWLLTVGCGDDARLGVPGEDLPGSHGARTFVAWYNGHPDHADDAYDLAVRRAVVVGVGNVALDLARILVKDREELAKSDIRPEALAALRASPIEEVVVLGRRGPVQAAFTPKEIEDLGKLDGVDLIVDPADLVLDAGSEAERVRRDDPNLERTLEVLSEAAARGRTGAPRAIRLVFSASPVEITGRERVEGVTWRKNHLIERDGRVVAEPTDEVGAVEAGLVLRSIGYRGHPVPGVAFDAKNARIPNDGGRVLTDVGGSVRRGAYVAGWAKRGPSGVVGTNRACAADTVAKMLEDRGSSAALGDADAVDAMLAARGVTPVRWSDWERLDRIEVEAGKTRGAVREKLGSWAAALAACDPG